MAQTLPVRPGSASANAVQPTPSVVTIEEFATLCQVSVVTMRRWQAAGRLPSRVHGKRRKSYLRVDVEAWLRVSGKR